MSKRIPVVSGERGDEYVAPPRHDYKTSDVAEHDIVVEGVSFHLSQFDENKDYAIVRFRYFHEPREYSFRASSIVVVDQLHQMKNKGEIPFVGRIEKFKGQRKHSYWKILPPKETVENIGDV